MLTPPPTLKNADAVYNLLKGKMVETYRLYRILSHYNAC